MAYLKGIDVSKWQDSTDWSPAGLTFVIARASIGMTKDPEYADHIAKANAAGLMTGAYHFNWDSDDDPGFTATPEQQARLLVQSAGDVDFLFLDVEGAQAFEEDEGRAFIAEVHRLGKKCGLYMSQSVFQWDWGQDYDWVAKWSSTQPTGDWEFWQYTSNGVATDGGRLDLDYFESTLTALHALSNKEYGDMPTITTYIPGQVATIKATANIRADAQVTATKLRALTAAETWTVVGWVTGGVDPDGGSNQWLVRFANGRWEYTAKSNVSAGPSDPSPYTKAQYDAVVAARDAAVKERDAAQAALTTAKAELAAVQTSLTKSQADLAAAKAALTKAQSDLTAAQAALSAANAELADWHAFKEAAAKVGM